MSDDKVKVDAIVVGGGPGGLAAALSMAQQGLEVIVIERGEYAGSKNVGGLFYGTVLNTLIPNAFEHAPIERTVSRRSVSYLGEGRSFAMSFGADAWSQPPYNNTYVVHRSQFDRWLAKRAEEAGASLIEGMVVEDLIYEGSNGTRHVAGVKLRGDEEFFADVVILADGANALVSEKARAAMDMKAGPRPQEYAVGVKEIIQLSEDTINQRFNLRGREGVAYDYLGKPFDGLIGGGFIYTARDCLHLGAVSRIESMVEAGISPSDLMDKFKRHPDIAKLIEGGELLEYSGHMLPEGGFDSIGQLAADGLMIVGDAAGLLNMSLYKEGTNHAMESGKLAGETAVAAKSKGDFSHAALADYETRLQESVALRDVKKYKDLPEILLGCPDVLSTYPDRMCQMMVDYFSVTGETKEEIQKRAQKKFFAGLSKFKMARDLFKARKLM